MPDSVVKSFRAPDEVIRLPNLTAEIVVQGELTMSRLIAEPGWRWSEHVGAALGQVSCSVEHVGLVVSGTATVAFDDGRVVELTEGSLFHVPAVPHDSWVIGDEPYVSLHFLGADKYATKTT